MLWATRSSLWDVGGRRREVEPELWSYEGQVEPAAVGFRCGYPPPPVVMVVAIWVVTAIITRHQVGDRAYLASGGVFVCVCFTCKGCEIVPWPEIRGKPRCRHAPP
ncbi:unnamed protein product [Lactuca virosa]|uniref:Uncharacterized protein n=1 Tax=Lactuca virosa TaxID=75947 RepID=A0AAU9ML14_9ASTR|nr:unnamed protein product [Lactuca virosa]